MNVRHQRAQASVHRSSPTVSASLDYLDAVLFFLNIIKFIKVPMLARILRVFLAGSWIFQVYIVLESLSKLFVILTLVWVLL